MKTILLLEDDENLNRGISLRLEKEGFCVLTSYGAEQAEKIFNENEIHLIISDIMLKDGDGITFCRNIRQRSRVRILFLTALDRETDIVNGYDIGADDYLTKPFSLMVLVSKVHALMRRVETESPSFLYSEDISVSIKDMRVKKGQEPVALSKKELQMLVYLLENPKQILSKEQIINHVWEADGPFVDDNTVPVNISRLKSKLKTDAVSNVRGMGYIWTSDVYKE